MRTYIILVLLLLSVCTRAQCPPGNVYIQNQAHLDAFQINYPNCTQINGDLFINEVGGPINSLSALQNITTIQGHCGINNVFNLNDLSGLESLTYVGGFFAINNTNFQNIDALSSLQHIGGSLSFLDNYFADLSALNNLSYLGGNFVYSTENLISENFNFDPNLNHITGDVTIDFNGNNIDFNGFSNITQIDGDLLIDGNGSIDNLSGFNNLNSIGDIFILRNSAVTTINGFNNLNSIGIHLNILNNNNLTNLDNFNQLNSISGNLEISENDSLLNLDGLQALTFVNGNLEITYNNSLNSISGISSIDPDPLNNLKIRNNPNLSFCQELNICTYLANQGNNDIQQNSGDCENLNQLMNECNNSVLLNKIEGFITIDSNADGCVTDPIFVPHYKVLINAGGNYLRTFTDENGYYEIAVPSGEYSVSTQWEYSYLTPSPQNIAVDFNGFAETSTADFCLSSNQSIEDVRIDMLPLSEPRPGTQIEYKLIYQNIGTSNTSGTINFNFDDNMVSFFNSETTPDSQTNTSLTWNYTNLEPFEKRAITISLNTFAQPIVNFDDTLSVSANITPTTNDNTPENNNSNLDQTVISQYDSTNKSALNGEVIMIDEIDDNLNYIIRFQNEGPSTVSNVKIYDTISSQEFNISSKELIDASHNVNVLQDGGNIEFELDNIGLTSSTVSENDSYGYVAFRIKPKFNISIGDFITNKAYVTFDDNAPTETNLTSILVNADSDGDSILDTEDNCPFDANLDQSDIDGDNIGDVCDDEVEVDSPYAMGFDTPALDSFWQVIETGSQSSFNISSQYDVDGNGNTVRLQSSSSFSKVYLVSPRLNDLTNDALITVWLRENNNDSSTVRLGFTNNPADPDSDFNSLQSIQTTTTMTEYLLNMDNYDSSMGNNFVIRVTSNTIFVDDFFYFQPAPCDTPTNFNIETIQDNSITLSWTGSGVEPEWELEYEEIGEPSTLNTLLATSETYTINGLKEGTEYIVRLRAKCDDNQSYSDWLDPIQFFTTCTPVTTPYVYSFENEEELSPCWSFFVDNNSNISSNFFLAEDYTITVNNTPRTIYPRTGNKFASFDNDHESISNPPSDIILISKEIANIDNNKRIKIFLISRENSANPNYNLSSLQIGTMSDPNDPNTFNLIESILPEDMSEFKNSGDIAEWKEHTIYFNNYSANDNYIALKHGNEDYYGRFFIDDFKYEDIPSCTEPLYPKITDVRYDEVDIEWETYTNSSASYYEIEYGPSGFTLGNGTIETSTSESHTIQNLNDSTEYDFYVRAVCGSDHSEWSVKGEFQTKCEGYSIVYNESFENLPYGQIENCWVGLVPLSGNSFYDESPKIFTYEDWSSTPDPHTGSKAIFFLNEISHPLGDDFSDQSLLVSPRLIGLDNTKKISFWIYADSNPYASPEEIIIGTMSDQDDYTTFTPFYTITDLPQNEDQWIKYEIEFSNYTLNDKYVAFKQAAINERQLILIDDFEYTELGCVRPTNLQAYQTGANQITVEWQDNNSGQNPDYWEIEYGPIGFSTGSGSILQANSNPFMIDNLANLDNYDYRVRAFCNNVDGFSSWSDPYSFTLNCEEFSVFEENFDQYDTAYQYTLTGIPGFCWTRLNNQTSGILPTSNFEVSPSSAPVVGFLNFMDNDQNPLPGLIVSPYLPDLDNNKIFKIWIRNETNGLSSNLSGVIIGTMQNPLDRNTFVPYQEITADQIPLYGKEFLIDFSNYQGNNNHIAILHNQENSYSVVLFDDMVYKDKPICTEPINFEAIQINTSDITLSWEDYFGSGNTFEIEYGFEGFQQGNGTINSSTGNNLTINNLNADTSYDFYIRSNCDSAEDSLWVGPLTITTSCSLESVPWFENFDNMSNYGPTILPDCFQGDNVWVSSDTNINNYQLGDGDSSFLYATFDSYGIDARLTTPQIYLEAGTTYNLSFKFIKEDDDFSAQSVNVWTGLGNTPELLNNKINYYSGFSFGLGYYHPIETIFTPVVSGNYAFLLDFSYSSIISTISVDSFSLTDDFYSSIVVDENSSINYDFENQVPSNLILESTENTACELFSDDAENVLLMSGGEDDSDWSENDINSLFFGQNSINNQWIDNQNYISKVNFKIDASNTTELYLNFDLKHTYLNHVEESLFRVLVNGVEVFTNTASANNAYENIEIDLSGYTGDSMNISIQHLGRHGNLNSATGDRAYLDNLYIGAESLLSLSSYDYNKISIYPNPTNGLLNIKSKSVIEQIEVFDMLGRQISSQKYDTFDVELNLSEFKDGIYFIKINSGSTFTTRKIIKK
jgi:uncharacterized repeat protein (TIGR01451 family)